MLKLTVFPETSEVELWDVKNQRMFLRRTYTRDVSVDRLYPGAKVTVMSRLLEVVDFADEHTRAALGKRSERTLAMVKVGRARAVLGWGRVWQRLAVREAPALRPPRSRTRCSTWGRS